MQVAHPSEGAPIRPLHCRCRCRCRCCCHCCCRCCCRCCCHCRHLLRHCHFGYLQLPSMKHHWVGEMGLPALPAPVSTWGGLTCERSCQRSVRGLRLRRGKAVASWCNI